MIPYMRGAAADIINGIISVINRSGNRKPGAVLYLGYDQRRALAMIEAGDPMDTQGKKEFAGWPIVYVVENTYVRLA